MRPCIERLTVLLAAVLLVACGAPNVRLMPMESSEAGLRLGFAAQPTPVLKALPPLDPPAPIPVILEPQAETVAAPLAPSAQEAGEDPDAGLANIAEQASLPLAVATPEPPAPDTHDPAPLAPERGDLWTRLTGRFAISAQSYTQSHPQIQAEALWFSQRKRHTERMLAQAEPFLWDILDALENRGLPGELALLPAVESQFNPFALSPRRAAGLWQFMPDSATHWGLKRNAWYDARRDTRAATAAALNYLNFLHQRFDDWPLALAAYNAGEGRIDQALARRTKGAAADHAPFWNLALPAETRRYVPRLLGLAEVIANAPRYGIDLPRTSERSRLVAVRLPAAVKLHEVAEQSGIELSLLRRYNAAHIRDTTDPDAGAQPFLLPAAAGKRLKDRLAWFVGPKDHFQQTYTVQTGDSLASIAEAHHLDLKEFARWNRRPVGAALKAGDPLTLWLRNNDSKVGGFHRVRYTTGHDDTLDRVARRFGLDIAKLCAWNDLKHGDALKPGYRLTLLLPERKR